jgi:hypothetical protein
MYSTLIDILFCHHIYSLFLLEGGGGNQSTKVSLHNIDVVLY